MVKIEELNEEKTLSLIQGEGGLQELSESAKYVALILTQDWCPQWHAMEKYLAIIAKEYKDHDIALYWVSYNHLDSFKTIMAYKESEWKNDEVPYVRYYKEKKLIGESNYVSRFSFCENLGL